MSMSQSIVQLVKMMMRGIETNTVIDPIVAANHFETSIESLDLTYVHHNGVGYVWDGDDEVMLVNFTNDGVEFDEHHEHPKTLRVIQCVLRTLTYMEESQMIEDESESDSDEFI